MLYWLCLFPFTNRMMWYFVSLNHENKRIHNIHKYYYSSSSSYSPPYIHIITNKYGFYGVNACVDIDMLGRQSFANLAQHCFAGCILLCDTHVMSDSNQDYHIHSVLCFATSLRCNIPLNFTKWNNVHYFFFSTLQRY
jgi:hypothetical protein